MQHSPTNAPTVLRCPNCGAPVHPAPFATTAQCAYCHHTINLAQRAAPVVARTPAKNNNAATLVVSILGLGGLVFASSIWWFARAYFASASGEQALPTPALTPSPAENAGLPLAKLGELTMDRTPEQIAAWAQQPVSRRIEVPLKDARFVSVVFEWPAGDASFISHVSVTARAPIGDGDPLLQKATALFGSRLLKKADGSHVYASNSAALEIGSAVAIRALPTDAPSHPNWHQQIAAFWQVLAPLITDQPIRINADTKRDWLGIGYHVGGLASLNTAVDVDSSRAAVLASFPSVSWAVTAGDLVYTVPLDDPWFSTAELHWANEKAGKLSSVSLRPPVGDEVIKNQKEISVCLTSGLGKPEAREADHLAGTVTYFWGKNWPKASANLYTGYLWLSFEDPKGLAPVTLANVASTLAGCAR